VHDFEQHQHDGNIDNDQECDHACVSLSEGLRSAVTGGAAASGSAALLVSSLTVDFVPNGVVNAQINATGQSNPPVAIPTQLMAFMARACGWFHFCASWPGSLPKLTTMITPTKIRTANTTKANASNGPNEESNIVPPYKGFFTIEPNSLRA
jgi:hypothetical protein